MDQPTVCAVMLTRDRPELAKRAVECFRAQAYENKLLFILNSGAKLPFPEFPIHMCTHIKSIGELRNLANANCGGQVIVHWDDDDWSHPNRITEQVALLQASGADVVGYNEMIFWREPRRLALDEISGAALNDAPSAEHWSMGEAWLYSYSISKPTLGTSLMYWRKTWEQRPFNPKLPNNSESTGEDWDFIQGRKVAARSSLFVDPENKNMLFEPRMIARIHGGNSSGQYQGIEGSGDWERVPEWDARVRELLK